jgi:hypothetical protein
METWIEAANREAVLIDRMRALLRMDDGISFAELDQLDGFRGNRMLLAGGAGNSDLVLWPWVSEEAGDALAMMIASGECHIGPASLLTYLADGCIPRLPIVKSTRPRTRPHWVPAILMRGPNQAARPPRKRTVRPQRPPAPRKRQLIPGKLRARR